MVRTSMYGSLHKLEVHLNDDFHLGTPDSPRAQLAHVPSQQPPTHHSPGGPPFQLKKPDNLPHLSSSSEATKVRRLGALSVIFGFMPFAERHLRPPFESTLQSRLSCTLATRANQWPSRSGERNPDPGPLDSGGEKKKVWRANRIVGWPGGTHVRRFLVRSRGAFCGEGRHVFGGLLLEIPGQAIAPLGNGIIF